MTESEHMNLINLWNCTEPMTPAQIERMEELDARLRGMRVGLPKGKDSPRHDATDNDPSSATRADTERGT